jgi:hypothetical protein
MLEFHGIVGRLKEKIQNALDGKGVECDDEDMRQANNEVSNH